MPMTLTAYLAKAAALGFSAAALPGPFQVYLISQALRFGWRRASLAALAPLVSDGPIVVVVLLLLARLPAWMLSALQVAGGFFIAYLARNALRAARRSGAGSTPESRGGGALTLAQAATVNLLSPVVYVFWATVSGPLFALGWRQSPALGLSFVGVFYATMIGVSEVLVVAFAALRGASPIVTRAVMFLAAGLMAALAIVQVIQGLDGLGVWR
jgi:threonine/homoserine/homoserine lactone efflux protein